MKNLKFYIVMLFMLASSVLFSQPILEHTSYTGLTYWETDSTTGYYTSKGMFSDSIIIFDMDHNLLSEFKAPEVTDAKFSYIQYMNKALISSEDLEITLVYFNNLTLVLRSLTYDINGNLLHDWGDGGMRYFQSTQGAKAFAFKNMKTEVYRLQGDLYQGKEEMTKGPNIIAYPNPSNSKIRINYISDYNSTISIYDYGGKLIEVIQIIPKTESTVFDVSTYPKGMYIYKVTNSNKTQISSKFVIN